MPLRELLLGASVDTVVPTTFMVGPTLATILHNVETVPATRLQQLRQRVGLFQGIKQHKHLGWADFKLPAYLVSA